MNYIASLQTQLAAERARAEALEAGIHEFWVFVSSDPKFGYRKLPECPEGQIGPEAFREPAERLDWIATGDVASRLSAIVRASQDATNEIAGS
jgi:hypothetical protein